MKRYLIAAALLTTWNVFAAIPAGNDSTLVTTPVPQPIPGWYLGASLLYLQPASTNPDTLYAIVANPGGPPFVSQLKQIDPSFDWGVGLHLGYMFPDSNNDFNADYLHFSSDDTDSVTNPFGLNLITPFPYSDTNLFNFGSGRLQYDLDRVDITFGQYLDIGCRLIMHPKFGIQFTDIERDFKTNYAQSPAEAIIATHAQSNLLGVGPMVGLDSSYYLGDGFGLVGHFTSGLLVVDDLKSKLDVVNIPIITAPKFISFRGDLSRRVGYEVDGKLGADYTWMFNPYVDDSNLTLEAGYYVSHYFNMVDSMAATETSVSSFLNLGSLRRLTTDVGFHGPYLSLTYHP